MEREWVVDAMGPEADAQFIDSFGEVFSRCYAPWHTGPVIVCIGTDRSTGDSLGPLVGYKLKTLMKKDYPLHGTLDAPVHAKNLSQCMHSIRRRYDNPCIIAVDACLGRQERVGCISLGQGPVCPGAGVNKSLPRVGQMHIAGIVNLSGFMEYVVLQNTRLMTVMRMADIISRGIARYMDAWSPAAATVAAARQDLDFSYPELY